MTGRRRPRSCPKRRTTNCCSPDEQRRYLTDVRGIRDEPTITEVQRLAEGLPLTMSMYADLIERNRNVTAATLATYQEPGCRRPSTGS